MADEQRPSGPPGGKRRRPPTTLDLKATEVASDPVKQSEAADSAHESSRTEAPAEGASAVPPKVETPSPPKPRAWRPDWLDASALSARMRSRLSAGTGGPFMAAAAAAAAALGVLLLALWGLGAFNTRDNEALAARLAALETQARDLAAKPAGVNQRAVDGLAARVSAVEKTTAGFANLDARLIKAEQAAAAPRPATIDAALTARVAALETAQKDTVSPAAQQADRKEIQTLAARVAALEQAAKGADEKIARAGLTAGADRAGRLAFVAVSLRSAVERGEPFTQELAAAKPLVADAATLGPLEPYAATGVPRSAALARELAQLSAPILNAAGSAPREGGILDRLQQNAERLVRIRPVSEAPGDDAATILARAEAKASHDDIAGALGDIKQLPDAAQGPAQAWIKKAEAQLAALAAARRLAENAVGALGKATP